MSRLIDAEKIDFNEVFGGQSDFAKDTRVAAQSLIDAQPTVEAVPVVHEEEKQAKNVSGLLCCPFCGWYALVRNSKKDNGYRVRCNNCGTKTVKYKTAELAIEAWNTRKPLERIVERLEEERKEITKWDSEKHYIYKEGVDWMGNKAIEIVKEEGE